MSRPIELVLSDVDGTLVTPAPVKAVTPATVQAAKALAEAGIRFCLTSGRPPRGMAPLVAALGLTTPLAAFNGGAFVTPDLKPLQVRALSTDALVEALEVFEQHEVDIWVYAGDAWLVRDPAAPHVAMEAHTVGYGPTVVSDLLAATRAEAAPPLKVVGVSDEHERLARCQEELAIRLGESVSATCSQPYYLDVTNHDANKGRVLEFFADYFKIDPARIATVGDGHNDVLMFHKAGLSIAMGNAADEVKRAATHVTAGNDADGFAKAVSEYILKR